MAYNIKSALTKPEDNATRFKVAILKHKKSRASTPEKAYTPPQIAKKISIKLQIYALAFIHIFCGRRGKLYHHVV